MLKRMMTVKSKLKVIPMIQNELRTLLGVRSEAESARKAVDATVHWSTVLCMQIRIPMYLVGMDSDSIINPDFVAY